MTEAAQLFWARTIAASPVRQVRRDRLRMLKAVHPPKGSVESVDSTKPSRKKAAPIQVTPKAQPPMSGLELAMVMAMGLVFDGSVPFRKDPGAYLYFPFDRPEGLPPFGIYICGGYLHFFISEQDIQEVFRFVGRGMVSYLDAQKDEVSVVWHLFTPRALAYGGAEQAVAASGLPRDQAHVVWQWWTDGLLGANAFSRNPGVHSTLEVDLSRPDATWLAAVEFLGRARIYCARTLPSVFIPRPIPEAGADSPWGGASEASKPGPATTEANGRASGPPPQAGTTLEPR